MITENSRADALTDDWIETTIASLFGSTKAHAKEGLAQECAILRAALAASPVEQAAAAPIDEPANPYAHQGSLGEAWRKGFTGGRPFAAPGSAYMQAYDEGKAARAATLTKAAHLYYGGLAAVVAAPHLNHFKE